jgi:signal transduction histidine kinase
MTRFLPRSLFGRLMLVLASGLIVAQLVSTAINLVERDSAILRVSGMRPAQRVADIVKLLDSMSPADRDRIAGILNVPPMTVSLDRPPLAEDAPTAGGPHGAMFATVLRAALGDDRPIRVVTTGAPPDWTAGARQGFGTGSMGGQQMGGQQMGGQMGAGGMHRFPPAGMSILTQVQLRDGSWATFDTQVPEAAATLPWRLLLTLGILLAAVLLLSYVAVRWVTRPLHVLASAADELGRDIHRPPLPEEGPAEVSRAARAFNTMQHRLVRLIDDRTRILAAMSHDLKTPITRMRLRAELLDDDEVRSRFERDLKEMETMVTETLEFMRGLGKREPAQPIDMTALLETLQSENEDMGRTITVAGRAPKPYVGSPSLLKRCIANLIDNAVVYGGRADVTVADEPSGMIIRVRDHGAGIPDDRLEAVFEPFFRLEGSRSRETGGTGLGLGIARDIARVHGGEVRLRNHEQGGLEATLTLPRTPA